MFRFRYNRQFKNLIKRLFNKHMIPVWICVVGIVAVFVLVTSLGKGTAKINVEDAELYNNKDITVGVVVGADGMSEYNEQGDIVGLNIDVMELVLEDIFPEKEIHYVEIESQHASYLLKTEQIDLAIGAFTSGVTKTLKLQTSVPYYEDEVYAYAAPGSGVTTLSGMIGKRVYATTTEFTAKSLKNALKNKGIETDILSSSSYPDLIYNMENSRADVVIAMRSFSSKISEMYTRVDEPVMKVGCRIIAWTDCTNTMKLINNSLQELSDDGVLKELREKWGISAEENR
ncbi:MAG: transporter substrate-binding domain-containing protein [Christensenellaceae bacterium]|nr:transporter substrate-binding domain-containing protein [Christensenellaceae bacterium]